MQRHPFRDVETLFDEQAAEASYRNGVLTVTIPKARETHEEAHRVPVG